MSYPLKLAEANCNIQIQIQHAEGQPLTYVTGFGKLFQIAHWKLRDINFKDFEPL